LNSNICTLIPIIDGSVILHHKEFTGGTIYDDDCIWHREDGPAIIWPDGRVAWYINGREYSWKQWIALVDLTDEELFLLKMAYFTRKE
jgi:hypothetical protein